MVESLLIFSLSQPSGTPRVIDVIVKEVEASNNSPILETYVKPGREAAMRGRSKRDNRDLPKGDKGGQKK